MSAEKIEQDMDAFKNKPKMQPVTQMQIWFNERPDLWAAVENKVIRGTFAIQTMHQYLVEKHDFPFKRSGFYDMMRRCQVEARKAAA